MALFSVASLCLFAGFLFLAAHGLDLERSQFAARDRIDREGMLRVALWRLDSAMLGMLAAEQVVPAEAYGFQGAFPIAEPDVLDSPCWFRFRFLIYGDGRIAMAGRDEPGADAKKSKSPPSIASRIVHDPALAALLREVDLEPGRPGDPAAYGWQTDVAERTESVPEQRGGDYNPGQVRNPDREFEARDRKSQEIQQALSNSNLNPQTLGRIAPHIPLPELGPLVGAWVPWGDPPQAQLVFLRTLKSGGQTLRAGVLVDRAALQDRLLSEVADIFEAASIAPASEESDWGRRMASAPLELQPPPQAAAILPYWSPTRRVMALAGALVLFFIAAAFWLLHRALDLSERRIRFVSSVTHELRSPMTTFRLYTQLLRAGAAGGEEKRAEYLEVLEQESGRLARVLDSVLAFSKIEQGSAPPSRADAIEVDALLADAGPHLERRAMEAGFALVYPEAGSGLSVRADPQRVEQILMNLVDNSCKYASGAKDRRILLEAVAAGRFVELRVLDFGPGLAPSDRDRVFRAFERGALHASGTIPGVGLGLALAKGLARSMGGDLSILAGWTCGMGLALRLPSA